MKKLTEEIEATINRGMRKTVIFKNIKMQQR